MLSGVGSGAGSPCLVFVRNSVFSFSQNANATSAEQILVVQKVTSQCVLCYTLERFYS